MRMHFAFLAILLTASAFGRRLPAGNRPGTGPIAAGGAAVLGVSARRQAGDDGERDDHRRRFGRSVEAVVFGSGD